MEGESVDRSNRNCRSLEEFGHGAHGGSREKENGSGRGLRSGGVGSEIDAREAPVLTQY